MFKRNQKTAEKLGKIFKTNVEYNQSVKVFEFHVKSELTNEQFKQMRKLGLEVTNACAIDAGTLQLFVKRRSNYSGWIIATLSFIVVMGLLQTLYLASKVNLPPHMMP